MTGKPFDVREDSIQRGCTRIWDMLWAEPLYCEIFTYFSTYIAKHVINYELNILAFDKVIRFVVCWITILLKHIIF